jgi:hypothetical protein
MAIDKEVTVIVGLETQKLNLTIGLCSGRDKTLTTIGSREGAWRLST